MLDAGAVAFGGAVGAGVEGVGDGVCLGAHETIVRIRAAISVRYKILFILSSFPILVDLLFNITLNF